MGLFDGKRDIKDIVTLQTGNRGRVFFFDQEPMIKGVDDALWDYIFQEPTIFANSELNSKDKEYVQSRYPNFIDWYYFANALLAREWFSAQRHSFAGWTEHKATLLDCNLIDGSRNYRLYLVYKYYRHGFFKNSYISFRGSIWKKVLENYNPFEISNRPQKFLDTIPIVDISYDNWGKDHYLSNGLMQSRIPMKYYSHVNFILVSETVCVENKKHLTEKVFKPIVAAKPFFLVGGYKNLQYLQQYGFETFNQLWSENYDNVEDPKKRIDHIFDTIITTVDLYPPIEEQIQEKIKMLNKAHDIALNNRKHFWSDEFYNLLISEAVGNLERAKLELASKRI